MRGLVAQGCTRHAAAVCEWLNVCKWGGGAGTGCVCMGGVGGGEQVHRGEGKGPPEGVRGVCGCGLRPPAVWAARR